jgi:SAM-dependent methyltransferase
MPQSPNALAIGDDFEYAALQQAKRYRLALLEEFAPFLHGSVIEVGSGIGQITQLLARLPRVHRVLAVEPDGRFCEQLRQSLPQQQILQGTIDSITQDSRWDALVSTNVLEHIADDAEELRKYHALLAPARGVLCLFVPARQEIYAPLDRALGHYRRYARAGLGQMLRRSGFEVLRANYFNCAGYFAWWFAFGLLKRRHFNPVAVRLYDGVVFPLIHRLESRLLRPPLGQSLIAIARAGCAYVSA